MYAHVAQTLGTTKLNAVNLSVQLRRTALFTMESDIRAGVKDGPIAMKL